MLRLLVVLGFFFAALVGCQKAPDGGPTAQGMQHKSAKWNVAFTVLDRARAGDDSKLPRELKYQCITRTEMAAYSQLFTDLDMIVLGATESDVQCPAGE